MKNYRLALCALFLGCVALNAYAGDPASLTSTPTIPTSMTMNTTYGPYTYTLSNNLNNGKNVYLAPGASPITVTGNATSIATVTIPAACGSSGHYYIPPTGCNFTVSFTPTAVGTINDAVNISFQGGTRQSNISSTINPIAVSSGATFIAAGISQGGTPAAIVYESTDAAQTWTDITSSTGASTAGGTFMEAATGANGTLLIGGLPAFTAPHQTQFFYNLGSAWTQILNTTTPAGSGRATVYVLGNNGGLGSFLALVANSTTSHNELWQSTDLTNWSQVTITGVTSLPSTMRAIQYDGSHYAVLAGDDTVGGDNIYYASSLGGTWTTVTGPFSNMTAFGLAPGAGVWVATGYTSGDKLTIYSSSDLTTWTQRESYSSTSTEYMPVAFGNSTFVVLDSQANAYTSTDGITWAQHANAISGTHFQPQSIIYSAGANLFVAVGLTSGVDAHEVYYSTDGGIHWTASNPLNSTLLNFRSVAATA